MTKNYSCEFERLVCEALDKMTDEERQRFICNLHETFDKLSRLSKFTGLKSH